MSAIAEKEMEKCPKCGLPFDPDEHDIYECPRCGIEGSSACCNPGGRRSLCLACEESEEGEEEEA